LHIPLIISTNFHYVSPKDKIAYETAMAIKDQKQMTDPGRRRVYGDYHITSEQEVHDIMIGNGFSEEFIQSCFETSQQICDGIDFVMDKPVPRFPYYKTPQEFVELYALVKDDLIVDSD
jgi:DNA polymerase III alpha subunit